MIEFFLKNKYLLVAWVFLIAALSNVGYWVHTQMYDTSEFQGTFAVIPEPGSATSTFSEFSKTIERLEHSPNVADTSPEPLVAALPKERNLEGDQNNVLNNLEKTEKPIELLKKEVILQKSTTAIPYIEYGRSFNSQNLLPKVIIVITGLGQSLDNSLKAIEQLPPEVTLCFVPYARNIHTLMNQSRVFGHENLLLLPMEPESYPNRDPGPYTLLTAAEPEKNLQKLDIILNKGAKFVGVTDFMGSRFITSEKDLAPIFQKLKDKGLLFLESTASLHTSAKKVADETALPYVKVTRSLDPAASLVSIDDQLKEIEKIAHLQGYVILYAFMYPKVIDSLQKWIKTLKEKGFVLAPLTSVYNLPGSKEIRNE